MLGKTKKIAFQGSRLVPERVLTKLTSRVTLALYARLKHEASFSSPARTATYVESATQKSKTSSNATGALLRSKASFKYMSVTSSIDVLMSIFIHLWT